MSKMNDAELRRRLELLSQVQPSAQATSRALDRVRQTLTDPNRLQARKSIGRIIMNSKWTKLAAAAVIAIAVLAGLQFLGNPLGSNLTFAQVIQPILNANTAILDIVIGADDPNAPVIRDMVAGSRIRRTISNIEGNVSIIDMESGRILNLTEAKKEAVYIDLKGLPSMPNYMDQLRNALAQLQNSPHFVVEELGTREIDGRKAVGFLAKHPRSEITIWADAKTGLPIRIDQKDGQMLIVAKNLQFDAPMDEALFSMDVPPGYKLQQTELDLFSATEADFVEGLRVMAETFGEGQFPDGVALEDYLKQVPQITKKFEQLKLSEEEQLVLGKKMQQYILFLRFFKGDGKWYYRGKGVKLGEAEKPIFWYRPSNSKTYRVIYGDLHVADVAPENLPEPLAADDVPAAEVGYQQWSKAEFVGVQEDSWYVQRDGTVHVIAILSLMKGPKDTSILPVRLPYPNAPLKKVLLGNPDESAKDFPSLPFRKTGEGVYEVELPMDKLTAGQTNIAFLWDVSLHDLKSEQGEYLTVLHSLIPVVSYKLKVRVDANSGFEPAKETTDTWVTPFTCNGEKPQTQFGTCGLGVQKRR